MKFKNLFEECCTEASKKDSKWKQMFIKRMVKVATADRRILDDEIDEIAAIAEKINAREVCSKQFIREFGYDPFHS